MSELKEISIKELPEFLKQDECQLIDIREEEEFADFNIGGINVPSHKLKEYYEELSKYKTLIIACSNGTRSYIIEKLLEKKLSNTLILHLQEGIF
jgi:rhodanese-related sulfurtransferase